MCLLHTKQQKPACVYLALRIFTKLSNSSFLSFSVSMGGIPTFVIDCAFRQFLIVA